MGVELSTKNNSTVTKGPVLAEKVFNDTSTEHHIAALLIGVAQFGTNSNQLTNGLKSVSIEKWTCSYLSKVGVLLLQSTLPFGVRVCQCSTGKQLNKLISTMHLGINETS